MLTNVILAHRHQLFYILQKNIQIFNFNAKIHFLKNEKFAVIINVKKPILSHFFFLRNKKF